MDELWAGIVNSLVAAAASSTWQGVFDRIRPSLRAGGVPPEELDRDLAELHHQVRADPDHQISADLAERWRRHFADLCARDPEAAELVRLELLATTGQKEVVDHPANDGSTTISGGTFNVSGPFITSPNNSTFNIGRGGAA